MIQVMCRRNWGAEISNAAFNNIIRKLPPVIATHLNVGLESKLTKKDVSVWAQNGSARDIGDCDVEIVIFAPENPKSQKIARATSGTAAESDQWTAPKRHHVCSIDSTHVLVAEQMQNLNRFDLFSRARAPRAFLTGAKIRSTLQ